MFQPTNGFKKVALPCLACLGRSLLGPAFCLLSLLPMKTAQAADKPFPVFDAGRIAVYALEDRPGNMDISLFSGSAAPEQRQKYFTDGKSPSSINVFLLESKGPERRLYLIDTGYGPFGPGQSGLDEQLRALEATPDKIDGVLLTHMHMDHIGGLLKGDKRAFPRAAIFVSAPEIGYWTALADRNPTDTNAGTVRKVLSAYGADVKAPFAFDEEVLPGVKALDASGHTPGHTVFRIEAGGNRLLIIGDLLHAASLQFPLPDECPRYDMDRQAAVKTRKKILNLAAEQNIPIAGMHVPFPGAGSVSKDWTGYKFIPVR
ncbi:MAG: MBL fold metallo-hydrolase [Desulfovibrio sp.]|jgi:glyoxylase-like metal-dependent hydrolase (beta-lactamase superfamily II)|nr:MBL fold metallo-hydrolase [Desulfovibrio sp.]